MKDIEEMIAIGMANARPEIRARWSAVPRAGGENLRTGRIHRVYYQTATARIIFRRVRAQKFQNISTPSYAAV